MCYLGEGEGEDEAKILQRYTTAVSFMMELCKSEVCRSEEEVANMLVQAHAEKHEEVDYEAAKGLVEFWRYASYAIRKYIPDFSATKQDPSFRWRLRISRFRR